MAKPQRRDAAKERFWRRMVRRWQQSGLTGRAFCELYELSAANFYAWRRILAERDRQTDPATTSSSLKAAPEARAADPALPAFVQVDVAAERSAVVPGAAVAEGIELVVGGRVVRVRQGFDAALLRQVLRVLEEPTC